MRLLGEKGDYDIVITEIGGTVGDIESLPYIESVRQMIWDLGRENTLVIHLTLIPFLSAAGELKTKPTQHSVKTLMESGISADIIVCRTEHQLSNDIREKLALFCNVRREAVIQSIDVDTIYDVPLKMLEEGLDRVVLQKLQLPPKPHATIDTLRLAKRLRIPGRHDLGTLCRGENISLNNAHDAAADAGATLLLLWRLMAKYPRHFHRSPTELENWILTGDTETNSLGPGIEDLEPLEGTGGKIRKNGDRLVLNFGKYRSRDLHIIAIEDPGYIRWLCSPSGPLNEDARKLIKEIL